MQKESTAIGPAALLQFNQREQPVPAHIPRKPFLVTYQNPGAPRTRLVVWDVSTCDAIVEVMDTTVQPDCYISARPASADDCINYPNVRSAR